MTENEIRSYFQTMKVLLVDNLKPSHEKMINILTTLGFAPENINSAIDSIDGEVYFKRNHFDIVFCSYDINNTDGIEFLKKIQDNAKNYKPTTILLSSTPSQYVVSRAVEFDIDLFILKPFTYHSLYISLNDFFNQKYNPSHFQIQIETGLQHLQEKNYFEALRDFDKALDYSTDSSLAHYYLGQTAEAQSMEIKALNQYMSSLKLNPLHFKTLNSLYQYYVNKNDYSEAYNTLRLITKYYPMSSPRFCDILRLSIVTSNINHIPSYYNLFGELETKTKEMRKHLSAGLYVSAKTYLQRQQHQQMTKTIDQFVKLSDRNPKFIKASIELLLKADLVKEAQNQLKKFKDGDGESIEYESSHTLIRLCMEPTERDIEKALKLIPLDESICHWLNKVIHSHSGFKKYEEVFNQRVSRSHPQLEKQFFL
ncbi:MAG: response regulator [Halobacteriovoraceae bacterium]|nr:response regulator [Halobacteriovoraceae bacterium]MCB9095409.1 response regulator [Halobacteriovoraceae bacterium]